MHVTSSYLSRVLGITTRRVQQLAAEGIISRDEKTGKYYLPKCIQNYIEYKCAEAAPGNVDYERERALHEKAKREKAELLLAHMKGELHDAEQIEYVVSEMLTNFRTKLLGLPSKVAPLLVNIHEAAKIKAILTQEVMEVLNELKDYDPADYQNSDYIRLVPTDDDGAMEPENEDD